MNRAREQHLLAGAEPRGAQSHRPQERLMAALGRRGWAGRVVSVERLRDLEAEIAGAHREGLFDEEFFMERLAGFEFTPPATLPDARSVIVVAVSQPQIRITFTWQGEDHPFIVPSTYQDQRRLEDAVSSLVAEVLSEWRYRLAPANLPKKLLAARSGLADYGKNNLAYVEGMGSFHRLVVWYSDLPCEDGPWEEPRVMGQCARCRACLKGCPAGAISDRRFLLHAERCITFWNEKPRGVAFPSWLEPSWHHCLVGCLRCQWVCPLNRDALEWFEEGPRFTEEETARLLDGALAKELPEATAEKLERLEISEFPEVLSRNLTVLLARGERIAALPGSRLPAPAGRRPRDRTS